MGVVGEGDGRGGALERQGARGRGRGHGEFERRRRARRDGQWECRNGVQREKEVVVSGGDEQRKHATAPHGVEAPFCPWLLCAARAKNGEEKRREDSHCVKDRVCGKGTRSCLVAFLFLPSLFQDTHLQRTRTTKIRIRIRITLASL